MRIIFLFLALVLGVHSAEEKFELHGKSFRVFKAQPEDVRLVWKGANDKPLFSFQQARQALLEDGQKVAMLMNGGIFEPRQIPSGLYVEKGEELNPLNLKDAPGNFFLKPNAVFCLLKTEEGLRAEVVESKVLSQWSAEKKATLWYAVQSGPALLLEGKTHPAFNRGSKSELLRNGVGVDEAGQVVFVITDGKTEVNLWTFADCFRQLSCRNALFLDGDISQMKVDPPAEVKGHGFATIFGVVKE
ncbi:phosphodiester glycosidase family protein [Roseibacillus persicicus]|uniref:phosphodiester glycosidase family protein n=1 Tax=Roseibacillus persicicus TaxID=454148 RepID=UPI00398B4942